MNGSDNSTISLRRYVSLPIDYRVKVCSCIIYTLVGTYAVVANFLILYFKKKQRPQIRRQNQRAFSRSITNIFVQSLAWSDVLCGIVTFPISIVTFFVDILRYRWVCTTVRYLNFVFPVVTIINLFVIGVERYVGIFHPFVAPSNHSVKRLVIGAWIVGSLISFLPATLFTPNRHEMGPNSYTLTCVVNTNSTYIRAMMISFSMFMYIIPSIVLTITNERILRFLRRRRKTNPPNCDRSQRNLDTTTNTFVVLIFTFIIPYCLCIFNSGFKAIYEPNLSHTMDYILRHICGFLAYSNAAISPTIMFYTMSDLKRMLKQFLNNLFTRRSCVRSNNIAVFEAKNSNCKLSIEQGFKPSIQIPDQGLADVPNLPLPQDSAKQKDNN